MATSSQEKKDEFIQRLRRKDCVGSYETAVETAKLMKGLIRGSPRGITAGMLIESIKATGKELIAVAPHELSIGNIVRRVLHIIREEHLASLDNDDGDGSVHEESGTKNKSDYYSGNNSLLEESSTSFSSDMALVDHGAPFNIESSGVVNTIDALLEELKGSYQDINEFAIQQIHADEVILTMGFSKTVDEFLKTAAKKRSFQVFVTETAPTFRGHLAAKSLIAAGINTTVITDSAVFAMMPRVNKVILGTHAVVANGGLVAQSGCHSLCLAAKVHSVPVIVCAGIYKLCPLFPDEGNPSFNHLGAPNEVIRFEGTEFFDNISVLNPIFDYVPPNLVDLLITNGGGHSPDYLYRLLTDYYSPLDNHL